MAWVDSTHLGYVLGTGLRDALFPDSNALEQYELSARSTVESVMQYAGYASPGATLADSTSTTSGFLKKLVVAIMSRDAAAQRSGIVLPSAVSEGLMMLDQVYSRKLPIPGLTPGTRDGYGGSKFSATSGNSGRPAQLSRSALKSW